MPIEVKLNGPPNSYEIYVCGGCVTTQALVRVSLSPVAEPGKKNWDGRYQIN